MRTLLGYAKDHWIALTVGLVIALASAAANLAQPLATKSVVDALADGSSLSGPVGTLAVLVVVASLLAGAYTFLLDRTAEKVVFSVRRQLIGRLLRLRVPELDGAAPGDLTSRVTSDSTLLQSATTQALISIVKGAAGGIGSMVVMFTLDARLTGLTLGSLALVALTIGVLLPKIRRVITKAQEAVGEVGAGLDRALGAARTVKASGAEAREEAAVTDSARKAMHAGFTGAKYNALVGGIMNLAFSAPFLLVLGAGGAWAATGSLQLSTLIAFLLTVFYMTEPLAELVQGVTTLQQGLGAVKRIREVEDMAIEADVDAPVTAVERAAPGIAVHNVKFQYAGRSAALDSVSFEAPAGGRTAIVGPSGAGKTTLFALLQRFYEPESGMITVDGTDIAKLTRAEVRRRIGYVEQDAPALSGTLESNLRYAAPDATDEELEDVLRATRLSDLVERLPDGLNTMVGTRGVALSGGERQRLAIARALLRRPQVLLMDEATSQLDARNEVALREAVDQAAERCTVLLIAHRLSTVVSADRIVVLERGRVAATGTHEQLLGASPLYRELAASQLLVPEVVEQ
ncbi:ABC transporter ATP-binding protein [Kibdelosporangium phytohabitans]|uniref:ABC transporter ATP-binding protein n=1 Tax=Kibdelosporangium phytohabitans TaxID=860235 RepID=UPI000AC236C4|nr:ABC transporter ATP-binding protein [Kibdelosporangium phytohabitans]MBE1463008.1 ATP-binding cassette subfamily B protein/ATP-binding cassette subfamily C protein [Kibdelosporangium phytohabitans]